MSESFVLTEEYRNQIDEDRKRYGYTIVQQVRSTVVDRTHVDSNHVDRKAVRIKSRNVKVCEIPASQLSNLTKLMEDPYTLLSACVRDNDDNLLDIGYLDPEDFSRLHIIALYINFFTLREAAIRLARTISLYQVVTSKTMTPNTMLEHLISCWQQDGA